LTGTCVSRLPLRRLTERTRIRNLKGALRRLQMRRTRRIFERAPAAPSCRGIDLLRTLQRKYPFPPEYGYDAKSYEDRGIERTQEILRLPGAREATSFLELGCADGMVSCVLCRKGKNATAIDNSAARFDERAFRGGVRILQMDAAQMAFGDETFDFVFSYDAFEHFVEPERVLQEIIRVSRKGGHVYLNFGPLYMSPYGEHAYRSITVPYCQFLFPKSLINDFAYQEGLPLINFRHVNGWSLQNYRQLWNSYSHMLIKIRYHEHLDLSHLNLIRKYLSSFRSNSSCFDEFVVSSIEVLFEKTDEGRA